MRQKAKGGDQIKMRKKLLGFAVILALPLALAACAPTNSNTNVATIDLVGNINERGNLNVNLSPANQNLNASGNLNANTNATNINAVNQNINTNTSSPASTTITITSSGFSPKNLTVKSGSAVTWKNSSGGTVEVASDPHPTHTDLPDLNSGSLANGASYTYTFSKLGTWGYHDHFDPTVKGTVVVE